MNLNPQTRITQQKVWLPSYWLQYPFFKMKQKVAKQVRNGKKSNVSISEWVRSTHSLFKICNTCVLKEGPPVNDVICERSLTPIVACFFFLKICFGLPAFNSSSLNLVSSLKVSWLLTTSFFFFQNNFLLIGAIWMGLEPPSTSSTSIRWTPERPMSWKEILFNFSKIVPGKNGSCGPT